MGDTLPSSPRIDYLSRLPNELLSQIFEETYADWNQGKTGLAILKPLTRPLSKRLLDLQRQGLYREIKLTRWTGARSFTSLVNAVVKKPSLGSLIISLHFDMPVSRYLHLRDRNSRTQISPDRTKSFFGFLSSLKRLKLAGLISQQDTSNLTIYSPDEGPLLVLASTMEKFCITSIADNWGIRRAAFHDVVLTLPPVGILPSTRISHLTILKYHYTVWMETFKTHRIGLVDFELRSIASKTPIDNASSSPSYITALSSASPATSIFSDLEILDLHGPTSEYSAPLLDVLPRTGISKISLVVKDVLPISSLISLVSTPTTLRSLVLSFERETGEIGTRVSTVDFDATFRGIDLETEDIAQDAIPDDWTYPQLPAKCSIEDLLLLREKAREAGVELAADKLYEAVEIQQAVDEDLELLDELWQKWKRNQKKVKKSGKARKSKK